MAVSPHRPTRRDSWPRRKSLIAVFGVLAAPMAGGCASATNSLNPGHESVRSANISKLGHVLVDEHGRTLYMFEKDPRGDSSCYGACLSIWPPVLTNGRPQVEGGAIAAKLSTFKRDDGGVQLAYNGHPLYYYQADTEAGDAYGQEQDQFGAEWYALSPDGRIIEAEGGGS